jgi:small basic protein
MESEYKSIEKRIEEHVLKPAGENIYDFTKISYGHVASMFRFPTTIRKSFNNQFCNDPFNDPISPAAFIGGFFGLAVDAGLFVFMTKSVQEGNYLPLAVLAGTNIVSGIYELRRMKTSRAEYAEISKQRKSRK